MRGSEILAFLGTISPSFALKVQGVFAIDNIPNLATLKRGAFLIINKSLLRGDGTHWFCALKTSDNKLR
jgi:hypothetical protein